MAECGEHPGRRANGCADCADVRDRLEAVGAAYAACTDRFPTRYQTAGVEDILDQADVLAWVDEFRTDPRTARSLLLLGSTGTGKTHTAYAALRQAVSAATMSRAYVYRTPRWKALTHADLIASLRPRAAKDHDAEAELGKLLETDLLFVDDLGAIKATEWVEEMTYRLINGRYEAMRPNIVTSNLPLAELKDAIGDRIASRLAQDSVRVVLTGSDRRRQRAS
jgi:DNA replication protein DnaC